MVSEFGMVYGYAQPRHLFGEHWIGYPLMPHAWLAGLLVASAAFGVGFLLLRFRPPVYWEFGME